MDKHEDIESFYDAVYGDQLLILSQDREAWLAWETEDGGWYGVRSRHEYDPEGPDGDRWRPVGPELLERIKFPIQCTQINDMPGLLTAAQVEAAARKLHRIDGDEAGFQREWDHELLDVKHGYRNRARAAFRAAGLTVDGED